MLEPDLPPTLGMVLESGRGSLPYGLIHGEPLVRCAVLALEEADIEPIDADAEWALVQELVEDRGEALVLHDALCPLTPPDFLARCAALAAGGPVVAAYRPVTDTIKQLDGDLVGRTVDRETLRALGSPVVLPAALVAAMTEPPGADLVALVSRLRGEGVEIEWIEAPADARRVASADDVRVLEALTARRADLALGS